PALAFGTPVFIPALLLAPHAVEAGHFLPELSAALVISVWPGIFLGTLVADSFQTELARDHVPAARGKGLSPRPAPSPHPCRSLPSPRPCLRAHSPLSAFSDWPTSGSSTCSRCFRSRLPSWW